MNLELNNKKVLITGASKGIGLAIAKTFLQENAKVILVSRGSQYLFDNEKILQQEYEVGNVFAKKCDCTNIEELKQLKESVKNEWQGLDIVVVNVGDGRSVSDVLPDDELWQKTWSSNFESALKTARTFLPMLEKSKGCFLFVSSIAGLEAFGAPTDYSTAKTAIIALAKNMARKLAPNVRVNVIAPGNVYFKGGSWDGKIQQDKKRVDEIIKSTVPMDRFATPQEVADSAVFLCSDKASFITGATGLLGKKYAEAVACYGGTPILLDLSQQSVDYLANELNEKYKVDSVGFEIDITNEEKIENNAKQLIEKFGRIDGLVNNAANNPKVEDSSKVNFSRLENFPIDTWNDDLSVGLTGSFLCAKHYGHKIAQNSNGGSIVNISSDLGNGYIRKTMSMTIYKM